MSGQRQVREPRSQSGEAPLLRSVPVMKQLASATKKPAVPGHKHQEQRGFVSGSYRDRTDDIHGVNVALYQLS